MIYVLNSDQPDLVNGLSIGISYIGASLGGIISSYLI